MKKLKIIIPVVLLVAVGVTYKMVLAPKPPVPKVHGQVYVLPKEFVLNLKDGRFVKLGVGLVVEEGDPALLPEGKEATPPDGYGPMPQEALVRDIVTDHLTDAPADELIDRKGRHHIKVAIVKDLRKQTDVKVEHVLFTDVAVQ
ncbi:MAG TPA: flagellar basal body-associated FliL family protein [Thermoleophilaceae bacterium]